IGNPNGTVTGKVLRSLGRGLGNASTYLFRDSASVQDFRTNVVEGLEQAAGTKPALKEALETKPDKSTPDRELESKVRFETVAKELNDRLKLVSDPSARDALQGLRDRFMDYAEGRQPLPDQSPKELVKRAQGDLREASRSRLRRLISSRTSAAVLALGLS